MTTWSEKKKPTEQNVQRNNGYCRHVIKFSNNQTYENTNHVLLGKIFKNMKNKTVTGTSSRGIFLTKFAFEKIM